MSFRNKHKGRTIVIIGAGGTLIEHKDEILSFIKNSQVVTIGINRMTEVIVPDYHLWTNRKRWGEHGYCTRDSSSLILGPSITKKHAKKHYQGIYDRIDYVDKKGTPFDFKKDQIRGYFRTAGVLAVVIAHIMGAKNIFIAGMDGYTLRSKEGLKKNRENQHCYGIGHTDDSTWKECVEKDDIVYECLRGLEGAGVDFEIITPTVFDQFYKNKLNLK